jgi:signal peptidase I
MTAAAGAALRTPTSERGPCTWRRTVLGALAVLAVLGCLVLVRNEVAGPVRVASGSMAPTLEQGDVVLVDRRLDTGTLSRGDLITFVSPLDGEETLKRVVGLPGDVVVVEDSRLHVNGREVPEPYVDRSHWDAEYTAETTVPDDAVYVLGDERGGSIDSRDHGPVPLADVDGRVVLRLWPPGG